LADEVIIGNVGADGVASEITLQNLIKAVESLAKSKGDYSGNAGKKIKELASSSQIAEEAITSNTDAQKKDTVATNKATRATNAFARTIGGGILGAINSAFTGATAMGKAFLQGKNDLTDFAQHIPFIGTGLANLTSILDESFAAFQATSSVGASFNNDITQMRVAAAEARMGLNEYTNFLVNNSEKLAGFGGTVTNGARTINQLNKALGAERENLLNMGLTYEEINDGLVNYMHLNRAGSRVQNRSIAEQAEAAAGYVKNLNRLSKLTGKDADQIQQSVQLRQQEVAFQSFMARQSPENQAKIQAAMQEAAALYGDAGVHYLQQQFLGMPPLTDATRTLHAMMPDVAQSIRGLGAAAMDSSIDLDTFNAGATDRLVEGVRAAAEAGEDFDSLLRAGAAGLDGPASQLAGILGDMGIDFNKYRSVVDGQMTFDEQALRRDVEAARREQNARADATEAMVNFKEATGSFRIGMESSIIKPLLDALSPAIKEVTQYLQTLSESEEFKETMQNLGAKLASLKEKVVAFIDAFSKDPEGTIKEYASKALSAIGNVLGSVLKEAFSAMWDNMSIITKAVVLGVAGMLIAPRLMGAVVKSVTGLLGGAFRGIGDMIGGGGGRENRRGPSTRSRGMGAAGAMGAGIGNFVGQMGAGVMKGAAAGIAAFANPKILMGAGILAGSIAIIGAGIAGAAWLTGKALPTLAEGLESFEDLDGNKLKSVGGGMAAIAGGLAAFGVGSVVGGLGNLVGNIADGIGKLIGGDDPFTKIQKFASVSIDADRVKNNAEAFMAFGKAMAVQGGGSALGSIGNAAANLVDGLVNFFGGSTEPPWDKIQAFGNYSFNTAQIKSNAEAIKAYAVATAELPAPPAGSIWSAFKTSVIDFLGGETDPIAPIKKFGDTKLNTKQIIDNAYAVAAYAVAVKDMPSSPGVDVWQSISNGILNFLGLETDPIEPIRKFGETKLNQKQIIDNAYAISAYAVAIKDLPKSPSVDVWKSLTDGILNFLGLESDPMAPIKAFGDLTLNKEGIEANALAVKAYATAIKDFPESPSVTLLNSFRTGIAELLTGESDPMAPIKAFGELTLNKEGIVANAEAVKAYATAISNFPESPAPSVLNSFKTGIVDFLGGETDPFVPLIRFSNMTLGANTVANAQAVKEFATAMSDFPEIQSTTSFSSMIKGWFGEEDTPWDAVKAFGDADINAQAVTANSLAMSNFITALNGMPTQDAIEGKGELSATFISGLERISGLTGENITSVANGMQAITLVTGLQDNFDILKAGLDTDGVISYNEALQDLVETLGRLNEELAEQNSGGLFGGGTGVGAADILGQINVSSQGNAQSTQQLNTTMQEIRTLLEETKETNDKIEKNTKNFAGGSNVATGRVSRRPS
jgi:hypothetical protein